MKKRLAGVFLALVMVLSLLPMTALAVDVVNISNNIGITTESTQDTLDAALGKATVTLSSENGAILVTLQKSISFAPYKNLSFGQGGSTQSDKYILDLNGCSITSSSITIGNYADLTIRDSSADKTGKVSSTSPSMGAVNNVGQKLTIEGGTFESVNSYGGTISTAAEVETVINGGTFKNEQRGAIASYGSTTINGGTFEGKYAFLSQVNSEGKAGSFEIPASSTADVTATTGVFGTLKNNNYPDARGTIDLKGGTYNMDVSNIAAENFASFEDENGKFVMGQLNSDNSQAMIDSQYFKTLADAINAVQSGETIVLQKDIPDATGMAVDSGKNFTLDFNNTTYTLVGPGAGSSGTETNGFQLLKDSTITFKNGTIRIDENAVNIKRIIQNYADLTLENMQIYAEHQQPNENYALSFNNGNIVFKGNTSVHTSNDDIIAFDVCKFSSYPAATVTFDESYTGTINGVIVYDSSDASTHKLVIKGFGSFGEIQVSKTSASNPSIEISGGKFTGNVENYVVPGMTQDDEGNIVIADDAVAKIGSVGYDSLADAITAAQDDDTIIMLQGHNFDTPITIN